MRTVPIDVLYIGIDMQMQLKNTGHIMKIHVVLVFVSALQPRRDSDIYFLEQCQMRISQVADSFEISILKNNKVSQVMTVVFVVAQAPVLAVDEYLLVFT
jgi:hypothetical protein